MVYANCGASEQIGALTNPEQNLLVGASEFPGKLVLCTWAGERAKCKSRIDTKQGQIAEAWHFARLTLNGPHQSFSARFPLVAGKHFGPDLDQPREHVED